MKTVTVRVPATTANLGPGFDCLALALDLWNEAEFTLEGEGIRLQVSGEGEGRLPQNAYNLVAKAFFHLYEINSRIPPAGVSIQCRNQIPLGSGLGSSAAATLLGLAGANTMLGGIISNPEILRLAAELEGHADNAAAAIYGGLVIVVPDGREWLVRRFDLSPLKAAVVVPDFHLPTRKARAALPKKVSMADAVFNIGRTPLVVEALVTGDYGLLTNALQDRLHQPYRLGLIPGAAQSLQRALAAGAAAAALSGAGPGVVAFGPGELGAAATEMQAAFQQAGLAVRGWVLSAVNVGLSVQKTDDQVEHNRENNAED